MGEPAVPTAAERGMALALANFILDRIRNDEPDRVPTAREMWLLASTLKYYAPILEVAVRIAAHWRDQEGLNTAELDALVEVTYG